MLNQQNCGSWLSRIHVGLTRALIFPGIYGLLSAEAGAIHIYTLENGNSSVRINAGSQTGMYDWTVDGQDQLNQEWFWYRIGDADPEASIDKISCPTVVQPTPSTLKTTYANRKVSIQVLYSLVGGSSRSGAANISEQIKIRNLTAHALDFHFFQYADLDFSGTTQLGKNLAGLFNEAFVTGSGSSVTDNIDTEVSPGANHGVAGLDTLSRLNDLLPTTFTDCVGPSTNTCWTLEWDSTLAANGTLILSQVMNLDPVPVPEPSGLCFILIGLIACSSLKRS